MFVYGNPETINVRQRWKSVFNGKWIRNGERGEYFVLGRDYSGNVSYNFFFPVDRIPETTPDYWQYCVFDSALPSWSDKNKYIYEEQIGHMQNSNILFDKIDFHNHSTDPYTLIEYNITPNKIGLNRCMLDVAATWKTYGSVVVKRKINGIWWTAVFRIKPMAAGASLRNILDVPNNINTINSEEDKVNVKIKVGAEAINFSGYAKEKHIKEIKSKIFVDDKQVSEISSNRNKINMREINLVLERKDLKEGMNIVKIRNESYMCTDFAIDGLIKNVTEAELKIDVKKQKPKDPLQSIENKKLIKQNTYKVEPIMSFKQNLVLQAGQTMISKLKFNDDISDLCLNDENIKVVEISKRLYLLINKIPLETKSTISSIEDARELRGNYFDITNKDIMNKIESEKNIKFTYNYQGFEYQNKICFDVLGDIITNFNYGISADIPKEEPILVEEWIKNE